MVVVLRKDVEFNLPLTYTMIWLDILDQNQESPVNSVKESLELIKFYQRRTILPDNMEILEKEKLLNMVCNFVKSRKQNTPMEF